MTAFIGLLGGTFDPVHNGHIAVARNLCDVLNMDSVRFLLNAVPPHRVPPECPVDQRLAMLESAIAGDERLVADTRELHRTGPSYTVWTLRSLRGDFPDSSLCWIVGADAWLGLTGWHRWHELSSLAHFIVVERPGCPLSGDASRRLSRDAGALRRRTAGSAVLCDGPGVDVSASEVRRCVASGRDASALVPPPVWEDIKRGRLYGYQPPTP